VRGVGTTMMAVEVVILRRQACAHRLFLRSELGKARRWAGALEKLRLPYNLSQVEQQQQSHRFTPIRRRRLPIVIYTTPTTRKATTPSTIAIHSSTPANRLRSEHDVPPSGLQRPL
jgi:hypothetical protein